MPDVEPGEPAKVYGVLAEEAAEGGEDTFIREQIAHEIRGEQFAADPGVQGEEGE
jgi:hypothetical protein